MGFLNYLFGTGNDKNKYNNTIMNKNNTEQPLAFNGEEFSEEISTRVQNSDDMQIGDAYSTNGVRLQNVTNMIRLIYDGYLVNNGANEIYAVVGYGNNLKWENVSTHKLNKRYDSKFELLFPVNYQGNINIAFKDGAGNWDNNNGMNYTFSNNFYQGNQGSH